MTKYEMTEKLAEKMNVSTKEAETALEFCDWDMLDAALQLERERGQSPETYSTSAEREEHTAEQTENPAEARRERKKRWKAGFEKFWNLLRRIVACGNRNRFEVRRKGERLLDLPVTVLVIALYFAFWFCFILLAIGLFTGCRYAFSGPELGKEFVNRAMDHAADAAEKMKEEAAKD